MGFEGMSRLCNPSVLGIINEFEGSPNTKKLAQLVIEIYGVASILEEAKNRKLLLEYLDEKNAEELSSKLGVRDKYSTPWEGLLRKKFSFESIADLYEYFDCEKPEESTAVQGRSFCTTVESNYGLFEHQEKAAQKIKSYLSTAGERVLLHMPTGSGKTRTAMSIACDFLRNSISNRSDKTVVWLCDTDELCDQAASEFIKAWSSLGVGKTNLYRVFGSGEADLSVIKSGFIVCGLQKLNSISVSQQANYYGICSKTTLVIFDEAHKAIAPTYKQAIEVFQSLGGAALLGLSATPGRSTENQEENAELAIFFNSNKVSLEIDGYGSPISYLQDKGYLSQVKYHDIPYQSSDINLTTNDISLLKNGGEPDKALLTRLGLDQKRNVVILSNAIKLIEEGRKIILFAPSVESAEGIYALLKYKDIKAGIVTATTPEDARRKNIKDYKDGKSSILVNYGVLTTGFDAPKTDVAIIARPTNSLTLFSQMVGRATRGVNAGGTEFADIYVIKDTMPGLRDMSKTFKHWDECWGNGNGG
ncbi:DEAD/DEAH box helicase [Aestuariirhabdus litorea]|uniref:DEAD/DEAH box helicase n=2 Tax=Aestuariirhabdus litorea TaxID=2528527 RepID=A0A3P3VNP9_9GAMM|nr:DEAD/DEAH box helicase [Aestuariirhabdus litorea]